MKIDNVSRQRQNFLTQERRTIVSGQKPAERTNVPLVWRVRQYVNNDGASYEPLLTDMKTRSDVDYYIQAYKGHISDADHEQYVHKFYSVRLRADQAIEIPIQIFWQEQLTVITSTGGVDTTEHTTGTNDNVVSRLPVSLAQGINDLHILTYTGVADQQLEITLDMAGIHSSMIIIDNDDTGITAQVHIDQPDQLGGASACKMIYVHANYAPNGITLNTVRVETGETSTYSVDYEIWDDPLEGAPVAIATIATSASTEAETSTLTSASVAAGQYVMASLPATDVDWVGLEIFFSKD